MSVPIVSSAMASAEADKKEKVCVDLRVHIYMQWSLANQDNPEKDASMIWTLPSVPKGLQIGAVPQNTHILAYLYTLYIHVHITPHTLSIGQKRRVCSAR